MTLSPVLAQLCIVFIQLPLCQRHYITGEYLCHYFLGPAQSSLEPLTLILKDERARVLTERRLSVDTLFNFSGSQGYFRLHFAIDGATWDQRCAKFVLEKHMRW